MTDRLSICFSDLSQSNRAAFVAYIMGGDPDLETSISLMEGLVDSGVDIIELGMPFSDPMADGPSIQMASQRSLGNGHTMEDTWTMVRRFRQTNTKTPIVLMGYYNPIYQYGTDKFLDTAVESGVDGLIVVDLPPEMDEELCLPARARNLNFIRLATPTTDATRLPTVLSNISGFLYYVSITGITGTSAPDSSSVSSSVAQIKKLTDLPICVGFGVKTPEQVSEISQFADGVVVGSAIVNTIADSLTPDGKATDETISKALDLVKTLSSGTSRL